MVTAAELGRLLSLVQYDARLSVVEGLSAFRTLLETDNGRVLAFLQQAMNELEGRRRGGIAFVIAEHYQQTGNLHGLRTLFAIEDAGVKQSVLNALWSKTGAEVATASVNMAIEAANHPAAGVRTEACYVLQNQAANKVDVSRGVPVLVALLDDPHQRVRHQAACAVGILAKCRYHLSAALPSLRTNVADTHPSVREATARTLGLLSRHRHDIDPAVPELVQLLGETDEWDGPRKQAASALLHHAKKSAAHVAHIQQCLSTVRLNRKDKQVAKFLEQFTALSTPKVK